MKNNDPMTRRQRLAHRAFPLALATAATTILGAPIINDALRGDPTCDYVVQPGDDLLKIGDKLGVDSNNITNATLPDGTHVNPGTQVTSLVVGEIIHQPNVDPQVCADLGKSAIQGR